MLRKIRTILAAICILLITLLFVDFTGMLHTWLGWLAKIQFLPAVLALNAGVILFLVVLTLVSIIRKSKFPQNPKRSVRFSGKGTKRSVQKRKARNTQKAETKVL